MRLVGKRFARRIIMKRHIYLLISVSCLSLGGVLSAQAGILPQETDLSSHTHNTHIVSQAKLLSLSQLSAQSEHRDFSAPIWQQLTNGGNLAQLASVCFITDAGNCGGAGGGFDSSSSSGPGPIDPDNNERCRLEGYVNTVCNFTQNTGSRCPYDNGWHTGCTCKPEYNKSCTETDMQGKGAACDGKYTECCRKCTGYNYTDSNIPTGHVKVGSCESCTGTKYKTKCDTNSSNTGTYIDCGSATGSGTSCIDDTGVYYTKCTCPNMYVWNATTKKCVCSTSYRYTCTGSGYSGGSGASCGGKYTKCNCQSGYSWSGGSCKKTSIGSFSCCDNMGYGCVCIEDGTNISKYSSVWVGYKNQGCDPVFDYCWGRGNASFRCK